VITDKRPDPGADAWLVLSARLQRLVAARSGRTDLVVRIGPGAPTLPTWLGGYRNDIAEVLIAGDRLPAASYEDPTRIDPQRAESRAEHAELIGMCCVAAAHAAHTRYDLPGDLAAGVAAAALALERARAAGAHARSHPADRVWIRASLLSDPSGTVMDALGLLALVPAGIITDQEAGPVGASLAERLGAEKLGLLKDFVARSNQLADGDSASMLAIAAAAAAILGSVTTAGGSTSPVDSDSTATTAIHVRRGIAAAAGQLANRRLHRQPPPTSDAEESSIRANAHAAARATFGSGTAPPLGLEREPDADLRRQAQALASAIRRSRYRAPLVVTRASALPPGRLSLAEVMRHDSQRAARAALTARPWRQLRRQPVDQPPLRIGLSWDISASMSPLHALMADVTWALARGAVWSGGTVAAVTWNSSVRPLLWPDRVPHQVLEPHCGGGSTGCPQSIRALDGMLRLSVGSGARLLVITTDLGMGHRRLVEAEILAMVRHGVRTIWITPVTDPRTPRGAVNLVPRGHDELWLDLRQAICSTLERSDA